MDIDRLTNQIQDFFVVYVGGEGGGGEGAGPGYREREGIHREWEQLLSYVLHCINLIYMAINFHPDIPLGYLAMASTRTAFDIISKGCTCKSKK